MNKAEKGTIVGFAIGLVVFFFTPTCIANLSGDFFSQLWQTALCNTIFPCIRLGGLPAFLILGYAIGNWLDNRR